MGRFGVQFFLEDNTWSTRYTITKNSQYTNSSTYWILLNLHFTEEK